MKKCRRSGRGDVSATILTQSGANGRYIIRHQATIAPGYSDIRLTVWVGLNTILLLRTVGWCDLLTTCGTNAVYPSECMEVNRG